MLSQRIILSNLTSLAILIFIALGGQAAQIPSESATATTQFRRIEQPLALKAVVTLGGLGLIGLELWWFLFSQTKTQKVYNSQNN